MAFRAEKSLFRTPLSLQLQMFILNKMLFALSDDVCGALNSFGGICAQFGEIDTLRNIDIADYHPVAMKYDEALSTRIEALAREWAPCRDYFKTLSIEQFDIKRELIQIHIVSHARRPRPLIGS